jgi:hypothetical protein
MKYAERTQVPVRRSRTEIETTVTGYAADQFGSAFSHDRSMVEFPGFLDCLPLAAESYPSVS